MNNRKLYPKNWREIRESVIERAGRQCEECGIEEGTVLKGRYSGKKYFVYLHAAHLDGDPQSPRPRLVSLCASCHMRMDRRKEAEVRPSSRRRGYSITTTDKLIKAVEVAGLEITEMSSGYSWQVDDLAGKSTTAIDAVTDALYYLRKRRG